MAFDAPCIHRVQRVTATFMGTAGLACVTLTFHETDKSAHEMEVYFDPVRFKEAMALANAINRAQALKETA